MANNFRFCVLGNTYTPKRDRFMPSAEKPTPSVAQAIAATAGIAGISGIELVYPQQVNEENFTQVQTDLRQHKLACAAVACSISSRWEYEGGSLTADADAVRRQAIATVKKGMDLAAALGASRINLWLGRDGFDYAFQRDYQIAWQRLVDGLAEICHHRPDLQVGVEYKSFEPRKRLFVANASRVLLLRQGTGCANLGALLDTGHALYGQESLAEVVALLSRHQALVHVHLNDNYRLNDDDLIVGTSGFLEFLEMFYWLGHVGYDGWVSFDPHPMLEEPVQAITEGFKFTRGMLAVLDRMGRDNIARAIASGDVTQALALVNRHLFGL